jgi:hypothetical protein
MINGLLVSMSDCRCLIRGIIMIAYEWLQPAGTHTATTRCLGILWQPLLGSLLCYLCGHLLDVLEIVAVGSN